MPELPEVESIRRLSERYLVGHTIREFNVTLPKLLRQSQTADPGILVGKTLRSASRRGKILDLGFTENLHLLVHFGLAGQWAIVLAAGGRHVAGHPVPRADGDFPHKSTHASIVFDDGPIVWYSDIRQFGWFNVLAADMVPGVIDGLALGPEATAPINVDRLSSLLGKRTVPVKAVMLDQRGLAGLGNMNVDEALFAARIHPARPARSLASAEVARFAKAVAPVLTEGIRRGGVKIIRGTSIAEDEFPAVHGREGVRCFDCDSEIVKIRVAGRGTYVCPGCQRNP